MSLISIINQGVKEGTEQVISKLNKGIEKELISESNDKENKGKKN